VDLGQARDTGRGDTIPSTKEGLGTGKAGVLKSREAFDRFVGGKQARDADLRVEGRIGSPPLLTGRT